MKTRSKALLLTLCAVLLVAASVLGTMAYLTSTDEVTNTFTVGQVKIKLDEAKANPDGSLVANADRVKANEYKLLPGHTYNKDPMVTVLSGSIITIEDTGQISAAGCKNSVQLIGLAECDRHLDIAGFTAAEHSDHGVFVVSVTGQQLVLRCLRA